MEYPIVRPCFVLYHPEKNLMVGCGMINNKTGVCSALLLKDFTTESGQNFCKGLTVESFSMNDVAVRVEWSYHKLMLSIEYCFKFMPIVHF